MEKAGRTVKITMICSTKSFVLRAYDFRETSKIAVFFTRNFGKVKGILKGIRKDPKKFYSTLPLLSLNHIVFYQKRMSEIHLVSQCDLLDDFSLNRGDLEKFGYSSIVCELVNAVLPLEDVNIQIFDLILDFLTSLKESSQDTRHFFEIKILALSGFKPHFDSCLNCDSKILKDAYFSYSRGGLLCPACLYQDNNAEPILQGTIASILYIERSSWQNCLRLSMLPAVKKQLDKILSSFIHFHIGRVLKSERVVNEVVNF